MNSIIEAQQELEYCLKESGYTYYEYLCDRGNQPTKRFTYPQLNKLPSFNKEQTERNALFALNDPDVGIGGDSTLRLITDIEPTQPTIGSALSDLMTLRDIAAHKLDCLKMLKEKFNKKK